MTRKHRSGYTLLEMLIVIAMMTIALGLGGTLLLTAMRADQVGSATLRDLTWRTELADQFREDVAAAVEAPDRVDKYTAGPDCLILRMGGGSLIYRWHDAIVDRIVFIGGQESRRPIELGEHAAIEFIRGAGERPIFTVRVITSPPHGTPSRREISVALGGDTR